LARRHGIKPLSLLGVWRDGWRRVLGAPAIAVGVFVMTVLLALPLAIAVRGAIASQLGDSLTATQVADDVDWNWWQEFSSQATGLGTTFTPSVIGFAATLDAVSSVLDRRGAIPPIAWVLALYIAGWAFLSGGILDRYARQRPTRAFGFFAAAGAYFFRVVRLAAIAGLVYWWLFAFVHRWLFDQLFVTLTRNLSVERTAFGWRLSFYVMFGAVLLLVNLLLDYTKVRIVVEDRRSVIGALSAAMRFIGRHPAQVFGLYALNTVAFMALLAVWALAAPGAGRWGLSMWAAFLVTQLYVVVRLLMKLQFLASQTALFQAHLAHRSYTAAPAPVWPDSAAAEAIVRGVRL
jgi:hypothetical protein